MIEKTRKKFGLIIISAIILGSMINLSLSAAYAVDPTPIYSAPRFVSRPSDVAVGENTTVRLEWRGYSSASSYLRKARSYVNNQYNATITGWQNYAIISFDIAVPNLPANASCTLTVKCLLSDPYGYASDYVKITVYGS